MTAERAPGPANEPVLAHAPGSPERARVDVELERQARERVRLPLVIGGERVFSKAERTFSAPHRHALELGQFSLAEPEHIARAIDAALARKAGWATLELAERAAVFRRAADLLSGPWRARLNAATMLNQSKTVHQAEIDAACELIDFFRFNAFFAEQLANQELISTATEKNRFELRPLEGFVYAITPFNFTSIAGNLPTAPALLGNTVVWKPSPLAALSAHCVLELLEAAGLPPGVINLVQGDAAKISEQLLAHRDFSGLHFTGSSAVFRGIWRTIGENVACYRSYPRVVGETGGKDFIVAHPSADVKALSVAIVRGGFEYQGQKCSAASRVFLPKSLAAAVEAELQSMAAEIRVGDPADSSNFMGAVIGRDAYTRISGYLDRAKLDSHCRIGFGGSYDDSIGYFIEPTWIEVSELAHPLLSDEIFGPVVSCFVYADDRFEQILTAIDQGTPYALTGAVFARDRAAVELATKRLEMSAGNFYINDKPTGAVVGQQPFGGARLSGTNDKAGSAWNLMRWVSPRVIKENLSPPHDFRYPFMSK
ncbi:MAG TPA: L-glutamate gamma-semialdehyde dehydrogenase [Polyangiaceae bacterium]|jgi:1-pyrroline-5-carboxylate dehydrogenase|nr:L-glutamate gamma-semialdehyde dehydrogenase [Polyangiaceae bacterium]